MKYKNVIEGVFISRQNRFVATVEINGSAETVHVKNTGRCRELLVPRCRVYLSVSDNPSRKTKYDLIAVEKIREGKAPLLINMDSQVVNDAAAEWLEKNQLFSSRAKIRREVTFDSSRFDFYIEDGERKVFLEVKGVTLENGGLVSFPDAPTERGAKHVRELITCVEQGYEAYILFVIQMKEVTSFVPNDVTDPSFGAALRVAAQSGVRILAYDCIIAPDEICVDQPVDIRLV